MAVTAALVKALREETGRPMMECKKALEDANEDYELAKAKLLGKDEDPEPALVDD